MGPKPWRYILVVFCLLGPCILFLAWVLYSHCTNLLNCWCLQPVLCLPQSHSSPTLDITSIQPRSGQCSKIEIKEIIILKKVTMWHLFHCPKNCFFFFISLETTKRSEIFTVAYVILISCLQVFLLTALYVDNIHELCLKQASAKGLITVSLGKRGGRVFSNLLKYIIFQLHGNWFDCTKLNVKQYVGCV